MPGAVHNVPGTCAARLLGMQVVIIMTVAVVPALGPGTTRGHSALQSCLPQGLRLLEMFVKGLLRLILSSAGAL